MKVATDTGRCQSDAEVPPKAQIYGRPPGEVPETIGPEEQVSRKEIPMRLEAGPQVGRPGFLLSFNKHSDVNRKVWKKETERSKYRQGLALIIRGTPALPRGLIAVVFALH